jgi:uncharacterized RDD family membrane protein YckC
MNCRSCGEVCHCHPEPPPAALETPFAVEVSAPPEDDAVAWRGELSARLHRYRARRKMQPPRYPSLRLQFDATASLGNPGVPERPSPALGFHTVANQALALDGMVREPLSADSEEALTPEPGIMSAAREAAAQSAGSLRASLPTARASGSGYMGAKIIEFPRFAWGPPPPPPDQLAEPVMDRPRILEAPEVAPPPPALGGITIEATERLDAEKRPGIDFPLQSAALGRRLLAGVVDGLIILAAVAVFGGIFWKVAAVRPPLFQLAGLSAGIPCAFWAAYQYLLIVYAGTTPGLRLAGLQLSRFDGRAATRSLRRWRVLTSYLSAASLGMGYAWVLLDEDVLCWHDRTTHTYLAPGKLRPKSEGLSKN